VKIRLAYLPSETTEAKAVLKAIQTCVPGLKCHESEHYPPFLHMYLSTEKPGNARKIRENT